MPKKRWEPVKVRHCQHAGCNVSLEVETIYPAEHLPDQPPRLGAHRCSHAANCNLDDAHTCLWAGTNPAFDPFQELPGE